ncbi:hypothetical protein QQF64_014260 [Cirrhinus molitorella]|uniref:Uncharacterized protein n=1 Tax=Cirrhinus molitorella TaxID=172907 RepID=A0ABR3NRK2_9TELE
MRPSAETAHGHDLPSSERVQRESPSCELSGNPASLLLHESRETDRSLSGSQNKGSKKMKAALKMEQMGHRNGKIQRRVTRTPQSERVCFHEAQTIASRYRKQVEEMQRAFNKTIIKLQNTSRMAEEQDQRQTDSIQSLQVQLENVTQLVLSLSVSVSRLQQEVSDDRAILCCVLLCVLLGCDLCEYGQISESLLSIHKRSGCSEEMNAGCDAEPLIRCRSRPSPPDGGSRWG